FVLDQRVLENGEIGEPWVGHGRNIRQGAPPHSALYIVRHLVPRSSPDALIGSLSHAAGYHSTPRRPSESMEAAQGRTQGGNHLRTLRRCDRNVENDVRWRPGSPSTDRHYEDDGEDIQYKHLVAHDAGLDLDGGPQQKRGHGRAKYAAGHGQGLRRSGWRREKAAAPEHGRHGGH